MQAKQPAYLVIMSPINHIVTYRFVAETRLTSPLKLSDPAH